MTKKQLVLLKIQTATKLLSTCIKYMADKYIILVNYISIHLKILKK